MKSHRTDGLSLTFGLIFLAIAGWYAMAQVVILNLPAVGWTVAGGLILLGLVGLAGALRVNRAAPATSPQAGEAARKAVGQPLNDADRAPVAERLRVALDEGRLSFTEYNERLQRAYTAITYEELQEALADLPSGQQAAF